MDLETIVIGLFALAVFVLPILYIQRKQKAKAGKALGNFLALGEQHQLRLTQHESWNEFYAIGLDEGQRKLFYLNQQEAQVPPIVVDLTEVKKCEVANEYRELNGNRIIDLIGLRLTFRNPAQREQILEFYSKEGNTMLSVELQLARKWSDRINAAIATLARVAVK
ncbi:hypothetical protein [Pontibacter roseus]|uniref:hypothetical protein n=1 Tax=Pontibacter roseus TaxID=336989 RepID=UPI00037EC2A0|nr:hypothetical protein [Pontibacter roseus]